MPPAIVGEDRKTSNGGLVDLQQVLLRQIVNLRTTRDLLLPRLMSGRLTLPEAEEAAGATL